MRISRSLSQTLAHFLILLHLPHSFGQATPPQDSITKAQYEVTAYLAKLADLLCTESVTQEKFGTDDHVDSTAHAKYDYLIMMTGTNDEFQLTESRTPLGDEKTKPTPLPLLVSNGIATLLVVFHPYYRDGFTFQAGPQELVNGISATPIHFTHIAGRRTPAALSLRGREYPLELQGTAWLDQHSGRLIRAEASLLHDMTDVGLRSMAIRVDYKSAVLGTTQMTFPVEAVVDVTTPRQHWRNTHVFEHYRWFSTSAGQDPKVNVHTEATKPDGSPASKPNSTIPRENH